MNTITVLPAIKNADFYNQRIDCSCGFHSRIDIRLMSSELLAHQKLAHRSETLEIKWLDDTPFRYAFDIIDAFIPGDHAIVGWRWRWKNEGASVIKYEDCYEVMSIHYANKSNQSWTASDIIDPSPVRVHTTEQVNELLYSIMKYAGVVA